MRSESKYVASTSMLQGTAHDVLGNTLVVKALGLKEKKAYDLWAEITKKVQAICHLFDMDDPSSVACVLNESATDIETPEEFQAALNQCEAYLIRTERKFDISRGDKLDFSGFTKGYIVRELVPLIKKAGAKDYLIDFGREVMWAVGNQPYSSTGWSLSLIDPDTEDEVCELELTGGKAAAIHWADFGVDVVYAKDALDAFVFAQVEEDAPANLKKDMQASLSIMDLVHYD